MIYYKHSDERKKKMNSYLYDDLDEIYDDLVIHWEPTDAEMVAMAKSYGEE